MSGEHIRLDTSSHDPLPPQNAASHNYDDESNTSSDKTREISSSCKLIEEEFSHHHPSQSSSRGHLYRRGKIRIVCIGSFIVLASAAFLLEGQVRYETDGGYFDEEVEHDAWYENGLNDKDDVEDDAFYDGVNSPAGEYNEEYTREKDNEYDFEEVSYGTIEDNAIEYSSEEGDEMQSDIGSNDFDMNSSDDFKREYISEEDDNFGMKNNSKDTKEYDDQYDSQDNDDDLYNAVGNNTFNENFPGGYNEEYISEEDDKFGMEDSSENVEEYDDQYDSEDNNDELNNYVENDAFHENSPDTYNEENVSEEDDMFDNKDFSQEIDGYSQDEENKSEDNMNEMTEEYLSEEDDGFSFEEDIFHPEQMYDMSKKPPQTENMESHYLQDDDDDDDGLSADQNKYITKEELAFDSAIKSIDELPVEPDQSIVFWHIPRTSGTSLQRILGECLGLTLANEQGIINHENDSVLKVISFPNEEHGKFVNVDTSTLEGLAHAKELGLVSSGLADVIVAMRIYAALNLFDDNDDADADAGGSSNNKGRLFTLMRHPVRRAISEFYHLAHANWEATFHSQWANMTLMEYATRPGMEENWMVRSLSNRLRGPVGESDLEQAKVILRDKCLLGFMDDTEAITDAMDRFERYFGWDDILKHDERAKDCHENVLGHGVNGAKYDVVEEDSPEWEMIARRNGLDVKLYEYAKEVYEEQGAYLYDEGII